jgi:hypothetical protein
VRNFGRSCDVIAGRALGVSNPHSASAVTRNVVLQIISGINTNDSSKESMVRLAPQYRAVHVLVATSEQLKTVPACTSEDGLGALSLSSTLM